MPAKFDASARRAAAAVLIAGTLVLTGCSAAEPGAGAAKGGPGARGPISVGYVVASTTDVPIEVELAGRVAAIATAEVRPQIAGLVRQRLFTEGGFVTAGQPLYRIDPALYGAGVREAEANLAAAEAEARAATVRADRLRPLARMEAISRQELDDAAAAATAAAAGVGQARARLETARTSLDFTTVRAPIAGRIGRSLVTEGALVTTNQPDPLAVIQRLDRVYVDIQQAGAALVAMRRAVARGEAGSGTAEVRLTLEDGSPYDPVGTLAFTEAAIDPATGTATLRATFPNPAGLLLPGMFVRARIVQEVRQGALLVPQTAVQRDPRGAAAVWLVGPDNKAVRRIVETAGTRGDAWIVTGGLAPGDRIVTQGTANLRPGAAVRAVPQGAPERIVPKGGAPASAAAPAGGAASR